MVLTTLSFQSSDVAQQASDLIYKVRFDYIVAMWLRGLDRRAPNSINVEQVACTDAGYEEFFSNQTISILNAIKTM